jgi:hypothetical protein
MSEDQVHVAKAASYADVDSFFHEGVTLLADDYFHFHGAHCGICHEAESATDHLNTSMISIGERKPKIPDQATAIQINVCSHVFHKSCLRTWIVSTRTALRSGTCPLCRTNIVERIYDIEYTIAIIGLMDLLDQIAFATSRTGRYQAERAYLVADDIVIERWGYASDSHMKASVLLRMSIEAYEAEQEERRCVGDRLRRQWTRLRASFRSVFRE